MGRIDISFETVRQRCDKLNKQIECKLEGDIIAGYGKLEEDIFQSGGEAVDMMAEELRQEKEALTEMKNFMEKMVKLMQESVNAFEETDAGYHAAFQKYGQEK